MILIQSNISRITFIKRARNFLVRQGRSFRISFLRFFKLVDFLFRRGHSERETGAYIGAAVREDFERTRTTYKQKRYNLEARSSVGERYIDTVEVDSSILSVPTIQHLRLGLTLIVRTTNLNPNRNLFANLLANIFSLRVSLNSQIMTSIQPQKI